MSDSGSGSGGGGGSGSGEGTAGEVIETMIIHALAHLAGVGGAVTIIEALASIYSGMFTEGLQAGEPPPHDTYFAAICLNPNHDSGVGNYVLDGGTWAAPSCFGTMSDAQSAGSDHVNNFGQQYGCTSDQQAQAGIGPRVVSRR